MSQDTYYTPFITPLSSEQLYGVFKTLYSVLPDWEDVESVQIRIDHDTENVTLEVETYTQLSEKHNITVKIVDRELRQVAQEEAAKVVSNFSDQLKDRVEPISIKIGDRELAGNIGTQVISRSDERDIRGGSDE